MCVCCVRWSRCHADEVQWRHLLFILLLILELNLILSPTASPRTYPLPSLLRPVAPRILFRPQYLQIRLLHHLFTSASIALSQLAGVWAPAKDGQSEVEAFRQVASVIKALETDGEPEFPSNTDSLKRRSGLGLP